jgi:hypothetical protein
VVAIFKNAAIQGRNEFHCGRKGVNIVIFLCRYGVREYKILGSGLLTAKRAA